MRGLLFGALFWLMFLLAFGAGAALRQETAAGRPGRLLRDRSVIVTTVLVWAVVAVPSLWQLHDQGIYDALHRDWAMIHDQGQWWRGFSSVLVQDGGLSGTVFNLITLAITVPLATAVWGPARAVGILVGADLVFGAVALTVATPPGGGNSGVTFTLATSLVGLAVVRLRTRRALAAAALVVVDAVAVTALGDPHGVPMLLGSASGAVLGWWTGRTRVRPARGRSSSGVTTPSR